jgi:signal transduction histidine kinase/DNA-binding response OmpR family regulator/HAMP domain-containing protein
VKGVSGVWKDLTQNVNIMASYLTDQVRNIAQVTTAVANGDLSQKITVDVRGEVLQLKDTINTMVDQLRSFAAEVTRVAREVGTEGKLGGQANVEGVSGVWKDLTDNVNLMASNLTSQVRNIADVTTAVARGDLSQKITVDVRGEVLRLKQTINTMVDQLSSFADEVTRVAREVGTDGKLGGQARVKGVSGVWKDLTDNVNTLAGNLTSQVRNIAQVTTAVARGDLSQKITVDVRGEILELKDTINTMVDQLSSFADEVTRVAREVGTEGKLGGQAQVKGVSGVWKDLTDNVNSMALSLTSQVRAIAAVSTAVTQGDLTRSIAVEAQGEVAELKDTINQMIANLRGTTERNSEQDWLNSNLARFGGMMQGQRDLRTVSNLIMSELTPLVSAHFGAFYLAAEEGPDEKTVLRLLATYGFQPGAEAPPLALGEGLVGQAAVEKRPIVVDDAPPGYIRISSGLGAVAPRSVVILPVLFEDRVMAVIELATLHALQPVHQTFLEQLVETIGIVINAIEANTRTEGLLVQSQSLAEELQKQQEELRQTNAELAEKAALLAEQNERIEVKNREIEMASLALEEKAEQLQLSSKYKSEFLANMSHELRTPLNSLLILARLLADNVDKNLTEKQVEFSRTIFAAGNDLLSLIDDILDLSKVEAGKMDVHPGNFAISDVVDYVDRSFRPLVEEKGLIFEVLLAPDLPAQIETDEQRLQQILRNLLSNAVKFTETGRVTLGISTAVSSSGELAIQFDVRDTGIGIQQERLGLIFEAFQQADGTTSRRFGGTGLGLSISKEIARLLGGEIGVHSAVGTGSSFTLTLPIAFQAHPGGPASVPPADATPAAEPDEALVVHREIDDDRDALSPDDRVLLIVEDDPTFAKVLLGLGREHGFKGVVALRGDTGLALAHTCRPAAIVLDLSLPVLDGWNVLARLKTHPATRSIPVHVISGTALDGSEAGAGQAATIIQKPVSLEGLTAKFEEIATTMARGPMRVLAVERPKAQGVVAGLIGSLGGVTVERSGSPEAALDRLGEGGYDCLVVDLKLPGGGALRLLDGLEGVGANELPVIVYAPTAPTERERQGLARHEESLLLVAARSSEELLEETTAFLLEVEGRLVERNPTSEEDATGVFEGKRVLIVDDDVRNVFALTSALEAHGMDVLYAENGVQGIEALQANADIDVVLMDVMMPELDGYETMRAIRAIPEFQSLPILAVTAKEMKEDRDRSIAAGASEWMTKPVNPDELLALIGIWLYPVGEHEPAGAAA